MVILFACFLFFYVFVWLSLGFARSYSSLAHAFYYYFSPGIGVNTELIYAYLASDHYPSRKSRTAEISRVAK
jgi:hypothetical protein